MNTTDITIAHETMQRRDRLVRDRAELLDSLTRGDPVAISVGNVFRRHAGATINPTADDMPILTDILRGILDRQIAQAEAHLQELGVTEEKAASNEAEFAEVGEEKTKEPRSVEELRAAGFRVIELDLGKILGLDDLPDDCGCPRCVARRQAEAKKP